MNLGGRSRKYYPSRCERQKKLFHADLFSAEKRPVNKIVFHTACGKVRGSRGLEALARRLVISDESSHIRWVLALNFFTHYLFSLRAGSVIRTIAWICILGVGVGVFSLVVVLSVMNGFNGTIRNRLLAVKPHMQVYHVDAESSSVLEISVKQGQQHTSFPFEKQDVIVRTLDGYFSGGIAKGLSQQSFKDLLDRVEALHRAKRNYVPPIGKSTAELGAREVYMGAELAESLHLFEGDQVLLIPPESLLLPLDMAPPYERVTIIGLIRSDMPDIDAKMIFYNQVGGLPRLAKSASLEKGTEFRMYDPQNVERLEEPFVQSGFRVDTWQTVDQALFFALYLEKLVMSIFLALACLIPSFCIVTVIVLLITQKKKDIGLLMALGLSEQETRKLFVRLSFMLSSLGIGWGLFLGLIVSLLIDKFPVEVLPDIYYDSTIPSKIEPNLILIVLVGAILVTWLASLIPAKASTRWRSPSEALR